MKIKTILIIFSISIFSCDMERNSSMERILKEISVQEKCEFKIISDDIK